MRLRTRRFPEEKQARSRVASPLEATRLTDAPKAGWSARADAVRPGRDSEPVASSRWPAGKCRGAGDEGFPRIELAGSSSLFFKVQPFPPALVCAERYYGFC